MQFNAAVYPIAPRSARDCEVFWRDGFRPNINRSEWTLEEVERLDELVKASKEDPPDWEDVAEQLGVRPCAPGTRSTADTLADRTSSPGLPEALSFSSGREGYQEQEPGHLE